MTNTEFLELKRAIEELHGCEASYVSSERVRESWGDTLVWDGVVSVFGIAGHPVATMCYAWSAQESEAGPQTLYAVLRLPPIQRGRDAVLVALAMKQKEGRKRGGGEAGK
jgi:hypothetical protein